MTSDVVLTAALRNNLLSLQSTQGLIDTTQFRLATGRKINSALDGPQSFFAAQALNNRASDLTRLLDAVGQSIQVIKSADTGITALTSLVEQADSVANAARDALAAGQAEAKAKGDRDLRNINDLTGLPGITAGDTLIFSATDEDGNALQTAAYGGALGATTTVTIAANMSSGDLVAAINDIQISDLGTPATATGGQAFEASLDDGGRLQIRTLNGGDFNLEFIAAGSADANPNNLALAAELGFANTARLTSDGTGNSDVQFTALSDVILESFALYDGSGATPVIADASDALNVLEDQFGNALFANLDNVNDDYVISINGGGVQRINLTDAAGNPVSIQNFVDQINNNTSLNTQIQAAYDATTGALTLKPIGGDLVSIEIGVDGTGGATSPLTANFGFGVLDIAGGGFASGAAGQRVSETIRLASAAAELAQLESDFETLRDQITQLVTNGDTGYRGTNLLNGDDLFTVFNEFRTSALTTSGVTFTADGLGLVSANFSRVSSTDATIANVRDALALVRGFGSTLANALSVIQAREVFTKSIINTLTEGADKLTVADQNEEGAKLLALQTRQQLGVTSLSLASQSQQSILRLF
ncbi:MAG: flagellin [Alphaproteobacteria bacterium CG_4_9_14_3_um_filter_47_13]|nr:MAG: flagellin [Alphaproteobacteria bacterium CG_4_9_14_3_um_filter_47_13]